MSRYQAMFDGLQKKREGAFIPFVVLGDPDLKTSKKNYLSHHRCGR